MGFRVEGLGFRIQGLGFSRVEGLGFRGLGFPRRSIYTTIKELGPKIPYYRRNYGSQFPTSLMVVYVDALGLGLRGSWACQSLPRGSKYPKIR